MADLSITAANVTPRGGAPLLRGVAGAAIAAGEAVYLDPADGKYKLADCDSATVAARTPAGIAINGAAIGQPVTIQNGGELNVGTVLTPGAAYYLSPNPGKLCPVGDVLTGDFPVIMGIARSNSILRIGILEALVAL